MAAGDETSPASSRGLTTDPLAPTARAQTPAPSVPQTTPSASSGERAPRVPRSEPIVGDVLGERYDVFGELGRGGEGVVLRAFDRKAEAVVAIKLLRDDPESPSRLPRFRRELALARKVTHPNVVRIHDLVELPGRFGLSMEYVEGETLASRLERTRKLSVEGIERLVHDLADALAAAHEAGVTHRDLKPSNILLRAENGRAVVTDFGVSRLHTADPEPISAPVRSGVQSSPWSVKLTLEGAIVGTPQYMAPEQLRGAEVGPAADVYAFGLVVFEAATAHRLHESKTLGELREERMRQPAPSLAVARPDLPSALSGVIDRCLQREPEARYPNGVALRAALRGVGEGAASRGRRPWTAILFGGTVLAAAVAVAIAGRPRSPAAHADPAAAATPPPPTTPPMAFHPSHPRRITFGEGCEEFPSFLPDGKSVVYNADGGGIASLFVLDLATGAQRAITKGHKDFAADVSPDGRSVAFLRYEHESYASYVTDIAGREEPRRLASGRVRPSWSRDGEGVWLVEEPLTLVDAMGGRAIRKIEFPDDLFPWMTRELSDGTLLVGSIDNHPGTRTGVLAVPPNGPMRWVFEGVIDEVLAVSPDEKHVFVTVQHDVGVPELHDVPLDGSPPASLLSSAVIPTKGLRFSPDGKSIVWSTCNGTTTIARIDRTGRAIELQPDVAWEDESFAWIPGTSRIVVVSTRSGSKQLWVLDTKRSELPRVIPTPGLTPLHVAVSPDGKVAAFRAEGKGIYVVGVDGGEPPRQMTTKASDVYAAFSRDGKTLHYSTLTPDGLRQVWAVSLDGTGAHAALPPATIELAPSPVQDRVAYMAVAPVTKARTPMIRDLRTGRDAVLSKGLAPGHYQHLVFSPDGRRVAVGRGTSEVVEVDVATGAVARVVSLGEDQIQAVAYVQDDLYVVRNQFLGDLWTADLP